MEFLETFDSTWKILGKHIVKTSAEVTSSCSDSPSRVWIRHDSIKSATDAMALLAILPLIIPSTRNYFLISDLREHIGKMAYNYRYEGKWGLVGAILQTPGTSIRECWSILLNEFNTNDWYGNFVPSILKMLRTVKVQRIYTSVTEDKRAVQRPKKKRGYDDKGTLRRKDKWLPRVTLAETREPQKPVKEPHAIFWFGLYQTRRGRTTNGLNSKKKRRSSS